MIEFIEHGENLNGEKIFARIDDDGLCRVTCVEENPEYQAWLNPESAQFTPNEI
jgi:hypothetical protein